MVIRIKMLLKCIVRFVTPLPTGHSSSSPDSLLSGPCRVTDEEEELGGAGAALVEQVRGVGGASGGQELLPVGPSGGAVGGRREAVVVPCRERRASLLLKVE